MSIIPAPSAEALTEDAEAHRKRPSDEGKSAAAPAEGADDVDPPTESSAQA
jgi:hypothetical protein